MSYLLLLILVTMATFAIASTAGALGIAFVWCASGCRSRRFQATPLLLSRLVPVMLGLLASALAAATFVRHEPPEAVETPGPLLLAAAAATLCLTGIAVLRVTRLFQTTRRFLWTVERTATRIVLPDVGLPAWRFESVFPLVAVVGVWRPRLVIARRVFDEIPPDELKVVLGHELAHARRGDNLARVLITGLPDLLSLLDRRLGLVRAWEVATEEAADDFATAADEEARISLASALVRVARMAAGQTGPAIPMLAIHRGDSIDRRVRRLLDPPQRSHSTLWLTAMSIATLLLSTVIAWLLAEDFGLQHLHPAVEWMVNVPR